MACFVVEMMKSMIKKQEEKANLSASTERYVRSLFEKLQLGSTPHDFIEGLGNGFNQAAQQGCLSMKRWCPSDRPLLLEFVFVALPHATVLKCFTCPRVEKPLPYVCTSVVHLRCCPCNCC